MMWFLTFRLHYFWMARSDLFFGIVVPLSVHFSASSSSCRSILPFGRSCVYGRHSILFSFTLRIEKKLPFTRCRALAHDLWGCDGGYFIYTAEDLYFTVKLILYSVIYCTFRDSLSTFSHVNFRLGEGSKIVTCFSIDDDSSKNITVDTSSLIQWTSQPCRRFSSQKTKL